MPFFEGENVLRRYKISNNMNTCVAFEGFVLLPAGILLCNLILCYLCKMVYVISGMSATEEVRQLTCVPESGR